MKMMITFSDKSKCEMDINPEKYPKCGNDKHYYESGIGYIEIICAKCGYQLLDWTDPNYEG